MRMPSKTLLSRTCSWAAGTARTSWYAGPPGSDRPGRSYRGDRSCGGNRSHRSHRSHRGDRSCGGNGSHRFHRSHRPIWRSHRSYWSNGSHRFYWSDGSYWSYWSDGSNWCHRGNRPCRDGSFYGIAGGLFYTFRVRNDRSAAGF